MIVFLLLASFLTYCDIQSGKDLTLTDLGQLLLMAILPFINMVGIAIALGELTNLNIVLIKGKKK